MTQNTYKLKERNLILIIIIFLINPFLSLLISIKDHFSDYFKNIIWMFCGFYGFTLFPVSSTSDSFRHIQSFIEFANQPNTTFKTFVSELYTLETNTADILLPMIKFVVSRFTDNPNIFYGVLGLLFGYFFSRNIWFLVSYSKRRFNRYAVLIIFTFALIIGPWEINSFRFWMAAHMLVFAVFKGLVLKKRVYLLLILITPFIHYGFLFVIGLFFVYLIIGNRIHIYYLMLISSLFFNGITSSNFRSIIPESSVEVLNRKAGGYASEDYIERRAEGALNLNWYVSFRITLLYYLTIFIAIIVFLTKREAVLKSDFLSLLSLTIFMMAVSFALMNIVPTFFRYLRISVLLFYGFLFLFMLNNSNYWYRYIYSVHLLIIIFFSIIELRIFLDTATIDTFISNPIVSMFYQTHEPAIKFIK